MWFIANNIDLHSIEWELIIFIDIRVLRLSIMEGGKGYFSDS